MITIERLSLEMLGTEEEGRSLAQLVAEELAAITLPPNASLDLPNLQVKVSGSAGAPADVLSGLIVADIMRQLDRST